MRAAMLALAATAALATAACGGSKQRAVVAGAQAAPGITVSPAPGSTEAMAQSEISFLGASRSALGSLSVIGSRSGSHAGTFVSYASAPGVSFVPRSAFAPGERVRVRSASAKLDFRFTVARPGAVQAIQQPALLASSRRGAHAFVSNPTLHPTAVSVRTHRPGTAPGDVFVAPITRPRVPGPVFGQAGPLILDGQGRPVWARPLAGGLLAANFRAQHYLGRQVLTWWEGRLSPLGYGVGEDPILDSTYRRIATVRAGDGYQADLHDFLISPRGSALLTAYAPVQADLSAVGGPKHGVVMDSVLQEIDIRTGRVMLEWDPIDHLPFRESYAKPTPDAPYDPYHLNSIGIGAGGDLLVSMRNTWAAYDLNPATGRINWRLGGKRTSYTLGPGVRFAWQHDVLFRSGGNISLFDDEAEPPAGKQSRGLLLHLDGAHRTAVVVREYTHSGPPLLAGSQGNTQILGNGDAFEGWGAEPYLSEYAGDGRLLFDAVLPGPDESYRSFRSTWVGYPRTRPSVAVRPAGGHGGGGGATTVYASWNGATQVARWEVLGGASATTLAAIRSEPRNGFETSIAVSAGGPFFAVRALDSAGRVLGSSPATRR